MPAQVGEYEVLGLLGQGGMGMVLRGRHRTLGVERAIKLMRGDTSEQARLRFEREASALARVDHPGVVRVHEARWEGGGSWFVMDLVEGQPLDEVLARGRLPLLRALQVAADVCEGVGALHRAGIVHRDLKPPNVILPTEGRPVVIDLGLAVAPELDQRLTRTGTVLGTFTYMSPEQIDGRPATPRSDVWALGLIAFELLTGARAVRNAGSVPELARQILSEDRPRPTALDPGLPAALDEVLGAALARDPARRPPDGAALAELLREVADAPGPSRRALRLLRLAVLGACAIALGVAGLGVRRTLSAGAAAPVASASAAPTPAPSASSDREARQELARIEGLPEEERRLRALEAWLERWGALPEAARAALLRRELLRAHPWRTLEHEGLLGAVWSGPGHLLSAGGETVRRWDLARGEAVESWRPGAVAGVAADPAQPGRFLVVLADGRLLRGRAGDERLTPLGEVPLGDEPLLRGPQLHPDGERLLLQTGKQEVVLLRLPEPGRPQEEPLRLAHPSPVLTAHFSSDGARVLSGCGSAIHDLKGLGQVSQCALMWDAADGRLLRQLDTFAQVSGLDLSPDGRTLAVASPGNEVNLLDLQQPDPTSAPRPLLGKGRPLVRLGAGDTGECAHDVTARLLLFSRDGGRLVTTAGDLVEGQARPSGELAVWNVATRRPLVGPLPRPSVPISLELDPTGARVALGLLGQRVEVWELPPLP